MSGSDEEGDYTLDIDQVTLEDDAKFQCQVARVPGYPGIQSTTALVNVQVKPEPPVIINGNDEKMLGSAFNISNDISFVSQWGPHGGYGRF